MLPALLLSLHSTDPVAEIDRLVHSRDIAGLNKLSSPALVKSDVFQFLKRGGAYGTGRSGWSAIGFKSFDGKKTYLVVTTKITCEDIGEQVFELKGDRIVAKIEEANDQGHKVERWDFDVKFDIPMKKAMISAKTRVKSLANASNEIQFRLSPQYKVSSIKDSGGKPVAFTQGGGVVSLAGKPGSVQNFLLDYAGIVDLKGVAGAMSSSEAMLTEDYWYPMIARKPAPFTATVHAPKGWEVVAQGEVTKDEDRASEHLVAYKMDVPVTYLSLAVGKYKHLTKTSPAGITYHIWSMVMTEDQMRSQLEFMPPIMEYYSKTFAPLPFRRYGALVTDLYTDGALEAYSFATYGPGWLPAEDGHETGHTWFGGMLDNTYLGSFWNESFADWVDGYYHRFGPIGNVDEKQLAMMPTPGPSPAYNEASCAESGVHRGPVASALGYGKGAAVLLQMEAEFPEMLDWIRTWLKNRPNGVGVDWSDFEKTCGPQTKWFFDEWIRRKGYPKFAIKDVVYGAGKVTGTIQFTGDPYRLTTDVLLRVDGRDVYSKVRLNPDSGATSKFEIPVSGKPSLVSFDPWDRLLIERSGGSPVRTADLTRSERVFIDPANKDWSSRKATTTLPDKLDGWILYGHPDTVPQIGDLIRPSGIVVHGNTATYDGTSVDLSHGRVSLVVDLPGGGHCVVMIGKSKIEPSLGHSRLALTDDYGRLLRAKTDPRTTGPLAFKL